MRLDRAFRQMALLLLGCPLIPAVASADPITLSGLPHKGALPTIITAFANQSGTDVLPAGATDYYVFTLYDTGSQRIYVDPITAGTLGLPGGTITDVRVNGIGAIDPVTLYAPIYAGQAQAEVQDIPVASAASLDITLVGGPVTNVTKAVIDYTTTVTRGPYAYLGGQSVSAPDITLYPASVNPAFDAGIVLSLQPFGSLSPADPGKGQRYWMYDVGLTEGATSVASPASGDLSATSTRFLYDTGTNVTLITDEIALALGLAGPPDFTMLMPGLSDPGPLNGYYLDSLTMNGAGGPFTILGAPVLVTVDPLGGSADAIIGSNLFAQSTLLFDGPGATLSIAQQAPEPSTLVLTLLGLGAVVRRCRRTAAARG